MKRYLYIGVGGILGSLTRYFLSSFIADKVSTSFPLSTFIINITGCFLLGFFLTSAIEFVEIDPNLRLAVSTGFIGSYTTFSTFTNEIDMLMIKQNFHILLLYFIFSFIVGLLSIWLGTIASRKYFCRLQNVECED